MRAKYPTERAAAKLTKCPHCSWTGSARGIFSHVRLTHSGKEHSLKIRVENPYVIDKAKPKPPKALGRLMEKRDEKVELEAFITLIIIKVMKEYSKMHDPLFRAKQ